MFKVTRFIVQREARGATVADPERFWDELAAVRRAQFIGRRAKVTVYRVTGEPESDLWAAPRIIATYGSGEPVTTPESNVIPFRRAG